MKRPSLRGTVLALLALGGLLFGTSVEAASPKALYRKGVVLLKGKGVEKDPAKAAKYLNAAARKGHAGAQFLLGRLHLKGMGVKKSRSLAVRWLSKARDQGHPKAGPLLAKLGGGKAPAPAPLSPGKDPSAPAPVDPAAYQAEALRKVQAEIAALDPRNKTGEPTAQDRVEAQTVKEAQDRVVPYLNEETLKVYRESADKGGAYYVFALGYLHEVPNKLVPQDLDEARRLYQKAVKMGYSPAYVFLWDLDHK